MDSSSIRTQLLVAVIAVSLVASLAVVAVGPVAAQVDPGAVTVALDTDGAATVSVTYRYDLAGERADAFEDLQGDSTAQEATAQRFADRVRSIAGDIENRTGRAMSISDPRAAVSTADGVGTVTVSVTWDGLAAVDGDQVTLAEPFDAGFESDRPLVVDLPDGYTAVETTPEPDSATNGELRWTADQSLSGFAVTAAPGSTPTTAGGPGFGVGVAVLVVILVALGRLR